MIIGNFSWGVLQVLGKQKHEWWWLGAWAHPQRVHSTKL
jgi:hypothetical protein